MTPDVILKTKGVLVTKESYELKEIDKKIAHLVQSLEIYSPLFKQIDTKVKKMNSDLRILREQKEMLQNGQLMFNSMDF